jgi:taurine dioxygenase
MSELWVQPTGGALGADIHGVDLSRSIGDAMFSRIAAAWAEHLVLRFSGQKLDDHQLMAFSARFGELDRVPIAAASLDRTNSEVPLEAREWVAVISSIRKNGKAVGSLGSYELVWHTDMSYNELPPRASLLYALEVPPDGGNTGFLNMYEAYASLPADLMRAIEGKTCLLFLGRRPGAYIHGLSVEESEKLLDAIWAHATQERFAWYQKWRIGDLVLWDNRCVMHRRDAFDDSLRRLMHRTQIVGEPVLAG